MVIQREDLPPGVDDTPTVGAVEPIIQRPPFHEHGHEDADAEGCQGGEQKGHEELVVPGDTCEQDGVLGSDLFLLEELVESE